MKVTCIEWTSKKVERICEVDREQYEKCKGYGIGYIDGNDIQTDAEGFDAKTKYENNDCLLFPEEEKILDSNYESKTEDVTYEILSHDEEVALLEADIKSLQEQWEEE